MNRLWPNILAYANDGFWEHEWVDHGTCTTFHQNDYFQTTCDLALRLGDIRHELQNNGLIATHLFIYFFSC